jgi:hypothetical protein
MDKLIKTYLAALQDPEQGELTNKAHGDYDGRYLEHGWWVAPRDWSLGVTVNWQKWLGRRQFSLLFAIGPFAWAVDYYPEGRIR